MDEQEHFEQVSGDLKVISKFIFWVTLFASPFVPLAISIFGLCVVIQFRVVAWVLVNDFDLKTLIIVVTGLLLVAYWLGNIAG